MSRELLIGCGHSRVKKIVLDGRDKDFTNVTTLDLDPNSLPDVEHDLNRLPLPFEDESFDEIHAYEVLEHCGRQGDFRFFFAQFSDFWRMLKPGGLFCATVPGPSSVWVWGDPGHTRHISPACLGFLHQPEYTMSAGVAGSPMCDYRQWYKADFQTTWHNGDPQEDGTYNFTGDNFAFALSAVKPSRYRR